MELITAQQARELGNFDHELYVAAAMTMIRAAAKNRHRTVVLHTPFWQGRTPDYEDACVALRNLGFVVELAKEHYHSTEPSTRVSW